MDDPYKIKKANRFRTPESIGNNLGDNRVQPSPERLSFNQRSGIFLAIIIIMVLGGLIRCYSYHTLVHDDGIFFVEHDPYYHVRRVFLFLAEFPTIPRTDYYTAFPDGLSDPWPPAFDFFMALLVKASGFDLEDTRAVELICAMTPVLIGVVTLVFTFMMIVQFAEIGTALLACCLLAVLPGHVNLTLFGRPDHHCIESLFLVLIVLLWFYWYQSSQRQNRSEKKRTHWISTDFTLMICFGSIVGLAFLSWLGSVIFVGFLMLLLLVQSVLEVANRQFIMKWWLYLAGSFLIAFLVMLPFFGTTKWSLEGKVLAYYPSWLQLITVLACFLFTLYLAGISLFMCRHGYNWSMAIFIHASLGFLSAFLLHLLCPEFLDHFIQGLFLIGSSTDVWLSHTTESQPLLFSNGHFSAGFALINFGYGIFLFPCAVFMSLYHRWNQDRSVSLTPVFLLLWGLFFFSLVFVSKRYASIFAVCFCFFMADAVIITGTWLFTGKKLMFGPRMIALSRGVTVIILLTVLFAPVCRSYSSLYGQDLRKALSVVPRFDHELLLWIRNHSPVPGHHLRPGHIPSYGVLAPNYYGHWLVHFAQRPVLFSPLAVRFREAAEVFLSEDVTAFERYCQRSSIRYILLNPPVYMVPSYARILGKSQKYQIAESKILPDGTMVQHVLLQPAYYRTITSRLYELDGNMPEASVHSDLEPLQHFRLIREAHPVIEEQTEQIIVPVKLFEFVKGARLTGQLEPHLPLEFVLRLVTNAQRVFEYRLSTTTSDKGAFEVVLPYATCPASDDVSVAAKGPYDIFIRNERVATFHLTEEDIQLGKHFLLQDSNQYYDK